MRVHEQAIALMPQQIAQLTQHQIEALHPDIAAPLSGAPIKNSCDVCEAKGLAPTDICADDGFWLPELEHKPVELLTMDQIRKMAIH